MADISLYKDGGVIGRRYRARASALFFSRRPGGVAGRISAAGRGPMKSNLVRQATLYNFVTLSRPPI